MERLKKMMIERGITQYQLAKAIGAKTNTVNNWFTGLARCPRDNYLNKIASFFNVHPAWLRYGDSQYAPTLDSEAQMLAEDFARYGPEGIKKARQMLKIFFEGTGTEKRYPIQKKARGQKAA